MSAELIAFASNLRALDADALYTAWLVARKQEQREQEAKRPDLHDFWRSLANVLDARYTEAERAA